MAGKALIVGCGDLGIRCARLLVDAGYQVTGARRNSSVLPSWMQHLNVDITQPDTLAAVQSTQWDLVIVALSTRGEEGYRQVYIDGLSNLLKALPGKPFLLFVSSTSVYSQTDGSWINETSPVEPTGFSGRRLLQAEQLLSESGIAYSSLRMSGLYGGGRSNHLLTQLNNGHICPATPIKYSNRIHVDDAARFIVHLADRHSAGKPVDSMYLVSDSLPVPLREVMEWLAEQEAIDTASLVDDYLPQRGGHKRCDNTRMLATGFSCLYGSYREGFAV